MKYFKEIMEEAIDALESLSSKENEEGEEENLREGMRSEKNELIFLFEMQKLYMDMFRWAYGKDNLNNTTKSQHIKVWKELHPNLPPIYVPFRSSDSTAIIVSIMQIMPHWLKHKQSLI